MNINIKDTFKITSRHLFVIVTDADYNDLIGIRHIFDELRRTSFPVYSVEWVNRSNLSMPGITLKYEDDKDLILLETMAKNFIIVE